ncbi:MAG: STAS/SEC14 domain-containing protein [Ferruginibacter sp.]|nr:STAS/SEC14 domain-containing protein [Cytophagales bacterium]
MNPESLTKPYYESKAVNISWNSEGGFIHVEWRGYATNAEYLEILAKQLAFTKQKKAGKILYDLRKIGVVSAENQKYTNEVYFPQMAQAGSKHAAIVIPESVFGEMSVNSILGKKNEALFEAKLFKDTDSASQWLTQSA